MTKERAITFSDEEVRAILEGRMASFRRSIFKDGQPASHMVWRVSGSRWQDGDDGLRCPWKVGDRLWVRETHWRNGYMSQWYGSDPIDARWIMNRPILGQERAMRDWLVKFDYPGDPMQWRKKSPCRMPQWASRITLEIISVHAERSANDWEWVVAFMVVEWPLSEVRCEWRRGCGSVGEILRRTSETACSVRDRSLQAAGGLPRGARRLSLVVSLLQRER